ncbi:transcriptional regulator [Dokdonella soli]|uniref:OmpR/PhoB-type domain-containing protein n=1 Tax=Dokdonella soli TaxID=529810 RepID=A0ABN1IG08_9GAMM
MHRLLYRFGDCTVDLAARELRRGGELVTLSPKVFDCLAYLIDHRDRAIGRDELIAAVWGRLDVTDAVLGQTMLKTRRAVADNGDEQNAIRTIPRFGYRWVADVVVEELPDLPRRAGADTQNRTADGAASAERSADAAHFERAAAAKPARRRGRRRTWIVGAATAAAFALGLTGFALAHRDAISPPSPGLSPRASVDVTAVLPATVDASPEWAWLRLGLMDLIAVRLRSAGMTVVPSDSVVALTGPAGSDGKAAQQLVRSATGAQRLIAPKVTRTAAGWRVHLDVHADGRDLEIEAQHEDAVAAARAAAAMLLDRLGRPGGTQGDTDALSLAAVQQRAEAALLVDDLAGVRQAIETASPALQKAPELRLRLAVADFRGGQLSVARQRLEGLLGEVDAETNPVLRARVLTVLGTVATHSDDIAGALRACAEATALLTDRNEPDALGRAYMGCGVANASMGRFDAAAADFARSRIALEITGDALSLARVEANEGLMENTRGHYAEGASVLRRAADRFQRLGAHSELIHTLCDEVETHLALLQPVEALSVSESGLAQLSQHENADTRRAMQLQHAHALAANGRTSEAVALLGVMENEVSPDQEQALVGQMRATRARFKLEGGQAETAIEPAREAVAALARPDDARERAMAWLTLVRALQAAGRGAEAAEEIRKFAAWSATTTIAAAPVYASLADAELRRATRNDATTSYEHALRASETAGVPADMAAVAASWGHALIDTGDLERASAIVGRVARWAGADFTCSILQTRLYRALGQEEAWRDALQRTRGLAGERPIPAALLRPPSRSAPPIGSTH